MRLSACWLSLRLATPHELGLLGLLGLLEPSPLRGDLDLDFVAAGARSWASSRVAEAAEAEAARAAARPWLRGPSAWRRKGERVAPTPGDLGGASACRCLSSDLGLEAGRPCIKGRRSGERASRRAPGPGERVGVAERRSSRDWRRCCLSCTAGLGGDLFEPEFDLARRCRGKASPPSADLARTSCVIAGRLRGRKAKAKRFFCRGNDARGTGDSAASPLLLAAGASAEDFPFGLGAPACATPTTSLQDPSRRSTRRSTRADGERALEATAGLRGAPLARAPS